MHELILYSASILSESILYLIIFELSFSANNEDTAMYKYFPTPFNNRGFVLSKTFILVFLTLLFLMHSKFSLAGT